MTGLARFSTLGTSSGSLMVERRFLKPLVGVQFSVGVRGLSVRVSTRASNTLGVGSSPTDYAMHKLRL